MLVPTQPKSQQNLAHRSLKVKLPNDHLEQAETKKGFEEEGIVIKTQADRVKEVMRSAFNGRRLVVFSGGNKKAASSVFDDARAIRDGGRNGSISGRNTFQRPRADAIEMLNQIVEIYRGKA